MIMTFSKRLQEVMNEKGVTKYRVAKDLHMSATTLSNYLKSKTKPDVTKLEVMSRMFGVNRKWLLTGEGEKYRSEKTNIEENSENFSVRDNDGSMVRYLIGIIDKQASSLKARDEEINKLMKINEILFGKLTVLLDKLISKL